MKQYLIQHKACTDAEVIALSLSDRNLLREKLLELMQGAVILCIIGTYDPDILAIPFLSAADVLAVPVERLPELSVHSAWKRRRLILMKCSAVWAII